MPSATTDLPPELLAHLMDELGINTSPDGSYSINVHQDASLALQAVYDPMQRKWNLVNLGTGLNGHQIHAMSNQRLAPTRQISHERRTNGTVDKAGDWTDALPATDHIELIKSTDWASTGLGPIQQWPAVFRTMTNFVLVDPNRAVIYWGPDRVMLYNEAFKDMTGGMHPNMMGQTYASSFPPELSEASLSIMEYIEKSRTSVKVSAMECFMQRSGFTEEAYFDGVLLPLIDDSGVVRGIYNSCHEVTPQITLRRRALMLNGLTTVPGCGQKSVWTHIIDTMSTLERDIPMAVLYRVEETAGMALSFKLHLEGCLGIKAGHAGAPNEIDLLSDENQGAFTPGLRQARSKGTPVMFKTEDDPLPAFLAHGVDWRGFGEPARAIVIIPLLASRDTIGFLILGTNARRAYCSLYQQFVHETGRLTAATIGASISAEAARARELQLSRELTERDNLVRRLAEVAPAGLYSFDKDGVIDWCNDVYTRMTGLSKRPEDHYKLSFQECIAEEDRELSLENWEKLKRCEAISVELRLTTQWTPPDGGPKQPSWIVCNALPNIDSAGEFQGVTGCITDISTLKWAADNATRARLKQERFIDMTSHEMRNPLSALMQCSDGITTSIEQSRGSFGSPDEMKELLENISDSAQTITLCANHQKRIIDDILTASKLDSEMLSIAPIPCEASRVVQDALQMFEAELSSFDIMTRFIIDKSYTDLAVEKCNMDPSRLSQIIVNLINNSIKFTKTAPSRSLTVTLGASRTSPPAGVAGNPRWFPSNQILNKCSAAVNGESCDNEAVYITFSVRDSGKGMTEQEMNKLFNRFTQANAKTHVQYGGSGLGLYISRELTELMGGMIGVSSVPEQGSTFAFFIKALVGRKAEAETAKLEPAARLARTKSHDLDTTATVAERRASVPKRQGPLSVLLVEDNLVNQKVLSKQLQRAGCTVHLANHGVEALDFLRRTKYWHQDSEEQFELTAILMDWEMPIMDGLTCTRTIRQLEASGDLTQHLKVIAITANARAEQIETAFRAGIDDLLPKPFRVEGLMEKILAG